MVMTRATLRLKGTWRERKKKENKMNELNKQLGLKVRIFDSFAERALISASAVPRRGKGVCVGVGGGWREKSRR